MAGVHHHGQVGQVLQNGDGGQVQGVPGVGGFVGADAPLAEDDLLVAVGHDVLGAHEQLLDGASQTALEEDGLIQLAQFLEHIEVLGVPGAHLDHVHILKEVDVADVHEFGNDGQAGGLLGLQQEADALIPQTLEVVGRGTGLEGATPEEVGPRLLDPVGYEGDLSFVLHGAGTGDQGEVPAADGSAPHLDDGVVRVELPVDRLEGVRNPGDGLHNVQALDHFHIHRGGVADETQNGVGLAMGYMDPQPLFFQPVDEMLGALRGSAVL